MTGLRSASGRDRLERFRWLKPDGSSHQSASIGALAAFIDTTVLPSTGTFSLFTNYLQANTGEVTLTLYSVPADLTGTIQPDGPAESVTINAPGQNALLSSSGTAGQRVSLNVSGSSPVGTVSFRRPDGSTLASVSSGVLSSFMEPQVLATTGTYTIKVDPLKAGTGTVTLSLYDVPPDITDSVSINGPARGVTLDVGQKATLTFSGAQGQQVTVRMTGQHDGLNDRAPNEAGRHAADHLDIDHDELQPVDAVAADHGNLHHRGRSQWSERRHPQRGRHKPVAERR